MTEYAYGFTRTYVLKFLISSRRSPQCCSSENLRKSPGMFLSFLTDTVPQIEFGKSYKVKIVITICQGIKMC